MGLLARFPLNGDKYSSEAFKLDDTLFDTKGKYGKYLKITNKAYYTTLPELEGKKQVSISFWYKEMSEKAPDWQDYVRFYVYYNDGTTEKSDSNLRYESYCSDSDETNCAMWYCGAFNTSYPESTSSWQFWGAPVVAGQEVWRHTALVIDFEKHCWTWYTDGKKREGANKINEFAQYLTQNVRIGDAYLKAGLNDLRIYDHCLTGAEVREIYRTPILKYSFDYPTSNPLINNAQNNTNFNSLLIGSDNACKRIAWIPYNSNFVKDGQYITISFDIEIKDLNFVESQLGKIRFQSKNVLEDGTEDWRNLVNVEDINGEQRIFALSDGTGEIDLRQNGKYHIVRRYQLTNTSTIINGWEIQLRVDYISEGNVDVTNFRAVLGLEEIPFNGTDGIIYDESGFENNGTAMNNLGYSTNSKIGKGCSVFDGVSYVQASTPYILMGQENCISFSFWFKASSYGGSANTIVLGGNVLRFRILGETAVGTIYTLVDGVCIDKQVTLTEKMPAGKWNHLIITLEGDVFKYYVNGKYAGTYTKNTGIIHSMNKLLLGTVSGSKEMFVGNMDDVRIYPVVLTEDDVKQIYKEREKIDGAGNLYCGELNENTSLKYIESDGSQYVDTEFVPNQDTTIEMGFVLNSIYDDTGSNKALYGVRENYLLDNYSMICGGGNTLYVGYDTNSVNTEVGITKGQYYVIKQSNVTTLNGKVISTLTKKDFTCPANLTLFVASLADSIQGNISKMELYYCKIWDGNTLVRDFYPAISTEENHLGEVCLYDFISNKYFYNAGTGKFITGIEKTEVKFKENRDVNCSILNEGFNIAKIKGNESIIETNMIYEN